MLKSLFVCVNTDCLHTFFKSISRQLLSVSLILCSVLTFNVSAESEKPIIKDVVRIGYIPHISFTLDHGLASGALTQIMECSTALFPRIEYVEMPSYERLMFALETNVVDIGLNMVRTKERDALAQYAVDIYRSRIILVTRDDGLNKSSLESLPVGRLAARLGSDISNLLTIKGYKVDVNAYTVDRLLEMFRAKHVNSFAEAEISVYDALKELDAERFDYDYQVLSEKWGGAYVTFQFQKSNPQFVPAWKKVVDACRYLAPELN